MDEGSTCNTCLQAQEVYCCEFECTSTPHHPSNEGVSQGFSHAHSRQWQVVSQSPGYLQLAAGPFQALASCGWVSAVRCPVTTEHTIENICQVQFRDEGSNIASAILEMHGTDAIDQNAW